jgi:tetratricopeptide (TPR) repeat protein
MFKSSRQFNADEFRVAMDKFLSKPDQAARELDRLHERLAELRAALSASASPTPAPADIPRLIADLQQLSHEARARADAQPLLRDALILQANAECRQGGTAHARDLLVAALQIAPAADADPAQLARDHYFLASVAGDLKAFPTSVEHYAIAARLAETAAGFDMNQRLGMRERHAFALHEAKRYEEAYAANVELIATCERQFGAADQRAGTVLINTAQNLYALRRLAEAEVYLQRALVLARAAADIEREQDLLYQLAVLASEQAKPVVARAYLVERVQRVETSGSARLLESARRGLAHFDRNSTRAP